MILNGIVGSSSQSLGYLSPSVPKHLVLQKQHHFFVVAPLSLFDCRVQVVVPSLSALFSNSTWELLSNVSPLLRSVLLNKFQHEIIFLFSPGSFNQGRIEDLLPSMQALDVSAAKHILSDLFPVASIILSYGVA